MIHSHDGLHRQILVSHVVLSLVHAIFSVVSLRDYPCHQPVQVVSSAAQAAAVVPPVRRHGEMLRLINRRQSCLNIKNLSCMNMCNPGQASEEREYAD